VRQKQYSEPKTLALHSLQLEAPRPVNQSWL